MGYFVDSNSTDRYFGLVFSCSDDMTCSGRICVVDSLSRQLVKVLPILLIIAGALFFVEIGTLMLPIFTSTDLTVDALAEWHIAVLLGSVSSVVLETLVVVVAWLRAVRAKAFCTMQTQLKIDWRHSYSLYLIPVIVFANGALVMLWVRSVPEYGPPDILFDIVLLMTIVTACAGIPRVLWLRRRQNTPSFTWKPEI